MSKYNGDFDFELDGKRLTICYDWKALSSLSNFSGSVKEIAKPIDEVDPEKVADVLACGLLKYHPEMNKEAILEWSPPLMRSIMVIDTALSYAYFGADGAPPDDKKKLMRGKKKTLLQRLFG